MSVTTAPASRGGARVAIQKFGTFLSNMIMPNIAAIIAWGIITALFIPDGPFPNEKITSMVGPAITFLLPILIAYAGGKAVYETRGGVVGAFSVMGVIMATSNELFIGKDGHGAPMFLGAMIMGPLAAWAMKKVDAIWAGKIKPGFEMLVDNFSAGILASIMAVLSMFVLGPIMLKITEWLGSGVNFLVDHNLLPFTSVIIEPAKVFFLNNAINHGVLTPLGLQQSKETGKSILFLLEANPGPGLGILLAYTLFGKGVARASAPGAAIIHFFGGIHEIYFPYVLMKPRLILAVVLGGATGVFTNVIFGTGLRAPAAPGSIIAVIAQTATDSYLGVILSVILSATVTCLVAGVILRADKTEDDGDIAAATHEMEALKGKKSSVASVLTGGGTAAAASAGGVALAERTGPIHKIVFACDAGMGSSAMGASVLRRKIQGAGFTDVTVVNKAIANLTDEYDVVVTHQDLTARALERTGSATHFSVDNFMGSPRYDEIVELVQRTNGGNSSAAAPAAAAAAPAAAASSSNVLHRDSVVLTGSATNRDDAITEAGKLLVAAGAVDGSYVDTMHEREKSVSTYMGNLLAIPHGTNEAKGSIRHSAISFVRYPDGIEWNGKPVKFVIGIAGAGDDHLTLLSQIANVFLDKAQIAELENAQTVDEVTAILGRVSA